MTESVKYKRHSPYPVVACLSGRIWQHPPYLHKASYTFSNEWSWRWQFELSHSCLSALRYDFDHWQGVLISQFAWFWLSQAGIRQCLPSCGRFNFHWREAKQATCSQHPSRRRPIWLLSYTMKVRLLFSASRIGGDKEIVRHKNVFFFISFFFLLRSVEMMDKRGEGRRTRIVNVSYFKTVDVTVPWRIEFLYFLHPRSVHSNHNMVTYIVTLTSQASC